jgi:site-specific DNA-methyltransferase (adenine-specific)
MRTISEFADRVLCGDCVKVLAELPAASVDLVVTDPPYAVRYRDRTGRTVANDDRTSWIAPAFAEVSRVMKDNAFCVSFYGWNQADAFLTAWRAAGLHPISHFVWTKPYASNAQAARFLRHRHECAYLLAKRNPPCPPLLMEDVLPWDYTGNHRHPTEKPVGGFRPLIEAFSRPGALVLDPFAGSCTTAVAAAELGRRYCAIELDERYCAIARERLRQR